jgi:hypothetical protein
MRRVADAPQHQAGENLGIEVGLLPALPNGNNMINGTQVSQSQNGDGNNAESSGEMVSGGPARVVLALALACAIGFVMSSAFLRNYGVASGELRLILMLLLFPVEWGAALLILALVDDFNRIRGRRKVQGAE